MFQAVQPFTPKIQVAGTVGASTTQKLEIGSVPKFESSEMPLKKSSRQAVHFSTAHQKNPFSSPWATAHISAFLLSCFVSLHACIVHEAAEDWAELCTQSKQVSAMIPPSCFYQFSKYKLCSHTAISLFRDLKLVCAFYSIQSL